MNRFSKCCSKNRYKSVLCKLYKDMYMVGNGLQVFSKDWNLMQFKNRINSIINK